MKKVKRKTVITNIKEKINKLKKKKQARKEKTKKEIQSETLLDCFKLGGTFVALTLLSGFLYIKTLNPEPKIILERKDIVTIDEKEQIEIFYPSIDGLKSKKIEVFKLNTNSERIEVSIRETLLKLEELTVIPHIDYDKEVLFYTQGTKVYLDVPGKIFDNVGNPTQELEIIYALTNSITSINGIDRVRMLIDNIEIEKVKYANLKKDYYYIKTT